MDNAFEIVEGKQYDKLQLALAIRNSTCEDEINCSLLENKVLFSCDDCSLKGICRRVDQVAADYFNSTTRVVKEFTFD